MEEVLEDYAKKHPELDLSDKMTWHFCCERKKNYDG
jgi:hypothetical protein